MPAQRKRSRRRVTTGWTPRQRRVRKPSASTSPRAIPKPGRRQKISTTVGAESYAFLGRLIKERKARNLAEAIDLVLDEARRIDNRERLETMTAEAYENMSAEAIAETKELEAALTRSVGEIHVDE